MTIREDWMPGIDPPPEPEIVLKWDPKDWRGTLTQTEPNGSLVSYPVVVHDEGVDPLGGGDHTISIKLRKDWLE